MRVLVTGGAGFIGSAAVRRLLAEGHEVLTIDNLAYAGSRLTLEPLDADPHHHFEQIDICDGEALAAQFAAFRPERVMHLAAESHVDRSIDSPAAFVQSNIVGTYTLLECALRHWQSLAPGERDAFRFLHVSTDEVYGSLASDDEPFRETTPYAPNSPYAASKAAADHLAHAWYHTYGLPVVISNCSNNYGPYQFPEKLIPLVIHKATRGEAIPVYGRGDNVRDWLFVEDHVTALLTVLERGRLGASYNIGGDAERSNIDVVRGICALLDEMRPEDPVVPHDALISFVSDRPGHDFRYAMDASLLRAETGWTPSMTFEQGLRDTVRWYLDNQRWVEGVTAGSYHGERLGQAR